MHSNNYDQNENISNNSICEEEGAKSKPDESFENPNAAMRKFMQDLTAPKFNQKNASNNTTAKANARQAFQSDSTSFSLPQHELTLNKNSNSNTMITEHAPQMDHLKIEELSNIEAPPFVDDREPRWATGRNNESNRQPYQSKGDFSTNQGMASSILPADQGFEQLQGLMSEKERANQELDRIEKHKSLTRAAKQKAIDSVKSLTRTIDGLIDREKDKISEHYESQLVSQVKLSNINLNSKVTDPRLNVFSDGKDLFSLERSNGDIQNSGSFVKSNFEEDVKEQSQISNSSSMLEHRPLFREDIQEMATNPGYEFWKKHKEACK